MRYLDPKSDLVFKRVFGEHANILISFLNALLPLREDQVIEKIDYLPTELLPEIPISKNSIVDVSCQDNYGRQFIVEMQMIWSDKFTSRMLYNASKTYVKQLDIGAVYKKLMPVYALALVNEKFEKDNDEFYHHYQFTHQSILEKKLDNIHLIFVEIPKFKSYNFSQRKLMVLWLRFISETKPALYNRTFYYGFNWLQNKALRLISFSHRRRDYGSFTKSLILSPLKPSLRNSIV